MPRKLGRPKLKDRSAVRAKLVTLKLTPAEHALLKRLVEARTKELRAETRGAHVVASVSSTIRDLIVEAAKSRGLTERGA